MWLVRYLIMSNKMPKEAADVTASAPKLKRNFIIGGLAIVLGCAVFFVSRYDAKLFPHDACPDSTMYTAKNNVFLTGSSVNSYNIEFAKTPSQQEMGLSKRQCLPKYGALVFLFPTDDKFGIWMKDMKFPIDVVWLDKDHKVVDVKKNMQPDTYPEVFYPKNDARYVLELNTGGADNIGASSGTPVQW